MIILIVSGGTIVRVLRLLVGGGIASEAMFDESLPFQTRIIFVMETSPRICSADITEVFMFKFTGQDAKSKAPFSLCGFVKHSSITSSQLGN